jgi:hypothetical protein
MIKKIEAVTFSTLLQCFLVKQFDVDRKRILIFVLDFIRVF